MISDDVSFVIALAKAATIVASASGVLIYLAWLATKYASPRRDR